MKARDLRGFVRKGAGYSREIANGYAWRITPWRGGFRLRVENPDLEIVHDDWCSKLGKAINAADFFDPMIRDTILSPLP